MLRSEVFFRRKYLVAVGGRLQDIAREVSGAIGRVRIRDLREGPWSIPPTRFNVTR
jgi:hypothetical protein